MLHALEEKVEGCTLVGEDMWKILMYFISMERIWECQLQRIFNEPRFSATFLVIYDGRVLAFSLIFFWIAYSSHHTSRLTLSRDYACTSCR